MQPSSSCIAWLTVIPASIITRAAWMAIRVLHVRPATTAEELATIEYYGGLHGREKMVAACDEACRVAVRIMRKYLEEQK